MTQKTVHCAKLNEDLPGIDDTTPAGRQALKLALLFGGVELQQKVRESISQKAWDQWSEYMLMVMNEYRLDPTSDDANRILAEHMQKFFFGDAPNIPGYTPPKDV